MDELMHYGVKRRSGRYPYGSGEDPYQHESSFLGNYKALKDSGMTESEIAQAMGMSINEMRKEKTIAVNEKRAAEAAQAYRLKEKGYGYSEIGRIMGKNESSIRSILDPVTKERASMASNTADVLKKAVLDRKYIDIGAGSEAMLGVTKNTFDAAVQKLKNEGYTVHYLKVEQLGVPGKYTSVKVLAAPDVKYKEIYDNRRNVGLVTEYHSDDGGRTYFGIRPPTSLDSSRVQIRYAEDGGTNKDGVIELRRGVDDISLGESNYAQVRIAVDGTHYLKGMAMYSDDMPPGVDVIFNTNKAKGTPMLGDKKNSVLKPIKSDPDNPFGAVLKESNVVDGLLAGGQREYIDIHGKKQLSPVNIVREEGDWDTWSKSLSSQFLSKQLPTVAKKQLDLNVMRYEADYEKISKLTQPEIKKQLLREFSDNCDAAAVHLKAAAMPRQSSRVILPLNDISDNEIYAPTYRNGETVVLIRYPHGGTFEIPELRVNNSSKAGNSLLGQAKDAVGISPKVAQRLSGADFDGDTVLVIPTAGQKIKTSNPLKGLEGFDPQAAYPAYEGMPKMKSKTKQTEMGKISNLITDMTIKGAEPDELARAVRHSMVVIDAEKHNLNYKQSYRDNGIDELKAKYQKHDGKVGGASTLISRAGSKVVVPERDSRYSIDEKTGEKIFRETGSTYVKRKTYKDGSTKDILKTRTQDSTQMAEARDARALSSGSVMEDIYADYANKLKSLANTARKEELKTQPTKVNKEAKDIYKNEIDSLNAKLNIAEKNAPLERQAQIKANVILESKKRNNPEMDKDEIKKVKSQALAEARTRVGASKKAVQIDISEKEWEAIQAGAISSSKLSKILANADSDKVKQLATPRDSKKVSDAMISRIKGMSGKGYTQSEIADALGVSTSTVSQYIK